MKKKLMLGLAASLLLAPIALTSQPLVQVEAVQGTSQVQGQGLLSLGASLDAQQAQSTMQLLGVGQLDPSRIIYVDGNMVNRFLQDGSGPGTTVYSSAYIQPMQEGYGVQVQIVTPQNITQVSALTYQNAAITAGARNAQLRIATVSPVTGEGALTGVYALLESQGVAVNPKNAQVAQKEIQVVNNVSEETQLTDIQVNQILAEIKTEITNNITNNTTNTTNIEISEEEIRKIVQDVLDKNQLADQANDQVKDELAEYGQDYAQTDAAKDTETVKQLESSIQGTWADILPTLEATTSPEDLLAGERLDFSDQNVYHPAIQAMTDQFYQTVEAGQLIENIYSHTFIFEAMRPDLSAEEKTALNELRAAMFQYASHQDPNIKQIWMDQLKAAQDLRLNDPVLAEITQRIANASGLAPEAFLYSDLSQEGDLVHYSIYYNGPDHIAISGRYAYDLVNGQVLVIDENLVASPVASDFDFEATYGVAVENQYRPLAEIPSDYAIPGYQREEASSEEASDSDQTDQGEAPLTEEPAATGEELPAETEAPAEEAGAGTHETSPEVGTEEAAGQ